MKIRAIFTLALASTLLSFILLSSKAKAAAGERLRYLPVQDGGRVKPFDTFAREMLELVYGKQKFAFDQEGERGDKVEAYIVVFTWMLSPEAWQNRAIFEVKSHQVKNILGLPVEKKYFKGEEIFGNDKFLLLRQELDEKRKSKEKLTPYFQALQRLENQFFIFREIASGQMLKVLPPAPSAEETANHWLSVAELSGEAQTQFIEISKSFATYLGALNQGSLNESLATAKALDASVNKFMHLAGALNPIEYEATGKVESEVTYNLFHPFRWAYFAYALAAVCFLLVWIANKRVFEVIAWILTTLGFFLHSYGFAMRIYLAERPPVTNMYETVVWVAWGVLIFSVVLERVYKFNFIVLIGTLVSMICLIIADAAPAVLDPTIQPLEAVLRSNYWLIVHVMTISISYAAFLLALGLGNLGLIYFLKGEAQNHDKIKSVTMSVYRAIQIGVAFLAPGIILGGIWADYSWGRFWGWDPKETWALIVLLGYLAVLHARLGGLLKDFGLAATSVVAFSLVIMAWYGVNFVLGAGLHSYGFGAGGIEYVGSVIGAQLLFVIYVAVFRQSSKASRQ